MKILFCNDSFSPRSVDSCYQYEAEATSESALTWEVLDLGALLEQKGEGATRLIKPANQPELIIYRGWMLTPSMYTRLYTLLADRNYFLINTPVEYLHCHWLPESYPLIQAQTPATIWQSTPENGWHQEVFEDLLRPFGNKPVIVKDYVKSRKHDWKEACFIPQASYIKQSTQIIQKFLELQGEDLQGGLVLREFVEFEPIGTHPQSGMPLTKEYRLFVLNGSVISATPYWDNQADSDKLPLELFEPIFQQIQSHFFTCDLAKTKTGRWLIVELGDGQVSGLPDQCSPKTFYQHLSNAEQF